VILELSDKEFYLLTPRQFHLLLEVRQQQVEYHELLNGLVCSTIANWSMNAPKNPLPCTNFMPTEWAKERKEKVPRKRRKKLNAQQVNDVFRALFKIDDRTNTAEKPEWANNPG
jgi:hypothetical protein